MPSLSSDAKLVVTACASALAGAAMVMLAMNWREERKKRENQLSDVSHRSYQTARQSYIVEDNSTGGVRRSSSYVLFPHNHEDKMRRKIAARAAIDEENTVQRNSVTVRVPATSANMGPGCTYCAKRKTDSFEFLSM